MVMVGGELTLEALGLAFNPRSGVYRAPIQALANGGVLVIDDFGRQRCAPRDLLNWWMVPLESRVEYLMLQSGEKVEMPFLALVIFSTNLSPSELVDEAFLRRIQYKIYAQNPTVEGFIRIFERCCRDRGIPFERPVVEALIENFYRPRGIELRACQPRDLINQALTFARYHGQPRRSQRSLLQTVRQLFHRCEPGRCPPRSAGRWRLGGHRTRDRHVTKSESADPSLAGPRARTPDARPGARAGRARAALAWLWHRLRDWRAHLDAADRADRVDPNHVAARAHRRGHEGADRSPGRCSRTVLSPVKFYVDGELVNARRPVYRPVDWVDENPFEKRQILQAGDGAGRRDQRHRRSSAV